MVEKGKKKLDEIVEHIENEQTNNRSQNKQHKI